MAVVKIGDNGTDQTLSTYSVAEDSTPVDPSDSSGGVAQVTFTIATPENWKSIRGQTVVLTDETQGVTSMVVTDVAETLGSLVVTANSALVKANVIRTAQPYTGTLDGAILYYLSLVEITSNIVIDPELVGVPVVFAGWQGNVYLYLTKYLASAWQFEMSLVGAQIVARPFRTREAVTYRDATVTDTISEGNTAQTVVIDWYPSTYETAGLAYPIGGWTPDVQPYQVNASQTSVIDDLPIGGSLVSVQQPVCVLNVAPTYSASSVYAVSGNDGLPITPAQWAATGGSLTLAINPDTESLSMTIVGSSITQYAPYLIAVSSGPSNNYSSLRIVGTGVFSTKNQLTLSTSLSTDVATQVVGVEVDMPFITTLGQAYDVGAWTLAHYSGLTQTIATQSNGINRINDSGSYAFPTLADFDAANAGQTVGQFDTGWVGQSIDEFNDYWNATVAGDFANQAFGNVGGARVFRADAWYRIRTDTNALGQISYSAEMDTTVGDFDDVWSGQSISDFDGLWAGNLLSDFDVAPLATPQQVVVNDPLILDAGLSYDSTHEYS